VRGGGVDGDEESAVICAALKEMKGKYPDSRRLQDATS
jgi:hypothetical protein